MLTPVLQSKQQLHQMLLAEEEVPLLHLWGNYCTSNNLGLAGKKTYVNIHAHARASQICLQNIGGQEPNCPMADRIFGLKSDPIFGFKGRSTPLHNCNELSCKEWWRNRKSNHTPPNEAKPVTKSQNGFREEVEDLW